MAHFTQRRSALPGAWLAIPLVAVLLAVWTAGLRLVWGVPAYGTVASLSVWQECKNTTNSLCRWLQGDDGRNRGRSLNFASVMPCLSIAVRTRISIITRRSCSRGAL